MTANHCCQSSRKAGEAAAHVQAAFFRFNLRGRLKAVAVVLLRLSNSPSTCEDDTQPSHSLMKTKLLPLLFTAALHGQEPADDHAQLLDPIVKQPIAPAETVIEPKRLDIPSSEIISSEVSFHEGQKFTIQEVAPQELPPIPPPSKPIALTAEQKAERAARLAARGNYRNLVFSCTVYDGENTMIRWNSQGKQPIEYFTAWSNVNFHYLNSLTRFNKNDTTYSIMFGTGDIDTAKMTSLYARRNAVYPVPVIPTLPEDANLEPSFVVTQGNPAPADLEPLVALHELYREHHAAMIAEYQRLKALREEEAAERAANPPDPKPDVKIRYWIPTQKSENTTLEQNQPLEDGGLAQ